MAATSTSMVDSKTNADSRESIALEKQRAQSRTNVQAFQTNLDNINAGLEKLIAEFTADNLKKWTIIDSKDAKESADIKKMKETVTTNVSNFILAPLQALNRLVLDECAISTDLSILFYGQTVQQLINTDALQIMQAFNDSFNAIKSNLVPLSQKLADISAKHLGVKAALSTLNRIPEQQTFLQQNGCPKVKVQVSESGRTIFAFEMDDRGSENTASSAATTTAASVTTATTAASVTTSTNAASATYTPSYNASSAAVASTATVTAATMATKMANN